jgi:putative FmdB family regulatory protein
MPTYEYRCTNGHGFEDFVLKMSDAKTQLPCPTCGERGERHLSAGGGLVFKGSGFYITDYGKDGKKSSEPALADRAKVDGAKSDGAKSDGAKPESAKADSAKAESARAESATSDGSKPASPRPEGAQPERTPSAPATPKSGSE